MNQRLVHHRCGQEFSLTDYDTDCFIVLMLRRPDDADDSICFRKVRQKLVKRGVIRRLVKRDLIQLNTSHGDLISKEMGVFAVSA